MTVLAEPPVSSSTATTPRQFARRNRGLLLLSAAVVVTLVLTAVLGGTGRSGTADPDSFEPSGARALATLLRDQGVTVQRTEDVATTVAGAGPGTTVFVPLPFLLSAEELSDVQGSGAHVVIGQADPGTVSQLGVDGSPRDLAGERHRDPGCGLPAAEAAGTVRIGGFQYAADDRAATTCYDGLLVDLPQQDLVLVGGAKWLTNERLDEQGNAALGLQLLGGRDDLRWFVPAPDREVVGDAPVLGVYDVMPGWVGWLALQLGVAAAVTALWRGRRLGRVVPEPLPVVVRAAETVEGRGRLYHASSARATAAEALRSGARDRAARRLGAGRNPSPEVLVDLVGARTSRPPAEVTGLLYGPPPVDDAALVRLARSLDALIQEVS